MSGAVCEWFAMCAPRIGCSRVVDVPICDRCDSKVEALS